MAVISEDKSLQFASRPHIALSGLSTLRWLYFGIGVRSSHSF